MNRIRGTVTYADGRSEEYVAGFRALIAWENYARRNGIVHDPTAPGPNVYTMTAVLAHYAVAGTEEGFATWLDTVVDVEAEPEAEAVPPSLRAAPDG